MKKTLLMFALTFLSMQTWASQTRFDSLQQARTIKHDLVEIFNQPSVMWSGEVADQVLFENNSGGVLLTSDNTRYGFYVGRSPDIINGGLWSIATYPTSVNTPEEQAAYADLMQAAIMPIHLFYGVDVGSLKYAITAMVAHSKKTNWTIGNYSFDYAQQFSSLAAGVTGDGWRADFVFGLSASSKDITENSELKGNTLGAQFEYDINDDWRAYLVMTKYDVTVQANPKTQRNNNSLGFERRLNHGFFYGIRYDMISTTEETVKTNRTALPLYLGGEVEMTNWLVLRGSYLQNLTSSTKTTTTQSNTLGDDASVAGGAGFRFGKSLIDVTTNVAGAGFFANVAYTYNF